MRAVGCHWARLRNASAPAIQRVVISARRHRPVRTSRDPAASHRDDALPVPCRSISLRSGSMHAPPGSRSAARTLRNRGPPGGCADWRDRHGGGTACWPYRQGGRCCSRAEPGPCAPHGHPVCHRPALARLCPPEQRNDVKPAFRGHNASVDSGTGSGSSPWLQSAREPVPAECVASTRAPIHVVMSAMTACLPRSLRRS